jgi:hypothetical protein
MLPKLLEQDHRQQAGAAPAASIPQAVDLLPLNSELSGWA